VSKAGQNYVKGYATFFSQHFNDNTNEQYSRAIRAFFNTCVLCGALTANPAASVKPPRSYQKHGKTPVIDVAEVTEILNHITANLSKQSDYRDRAMIATMAYGLFRISAVLRFKVRDYQRRGNDMWLIASEKGGKTHENPVHPKLQLLIDAHIHEANLADKPDAWLFPSSHGKSGKLNERQYRRNSAWEMVNRRAKAAGAHKILGNHSFRATGITTYMQIGGSLKKAQVLAGHAHISTTKLYDCSEDDDKVEEISTLVF